MYLTGCMGSVILPWGEPWGVSSKVEGRGVGIFCVCP